MMNILHVNNAHFYRGGADTIYLKTAELLKEHGHNPVFFSMHWPDNLPCVTSEYFMPYVDLNAQHDILTQLKIAGRILYSFEARKRLSKLLDKYPVDIAHLHNIYHIFSPSILHELKKKKIPIVMSIHDYKLVCGSYMLLIRDPIHGKICEACCRGRYFMTVKNRCVKNSLKKSILSTLEMYLHHTVLDIYDKVDIFIATSLFIKNKIKEMGFKKESVYLPNFYDVKEIKESDAYGDNVKGEKKNYVIYVGRLHPEKGLWTLLNAAKLLYRKKKKMEIKLSGDGPMRELLHEKVRSEKINNVSFLGYIKYKDLCREIKNSLAVVLSSECYENNPISVIESFAMGIPAVAARIGGIPELVKDDETGLTFEPANAYDLSEKIEYLSNNPDKAAKMGKNARTFVEQELNAEKHYQKLMEIYKQAIGSKRL